MEHSHIGSGRLYHGDNLSILRGHIPSDSVDLVYMDPPFNSNRDYYLKDGSLGFTDRWSWSDENDQELSTLQSNLGHVLRCLAHPNVIGRSGTLSYLIWLGVLLEEIKRVLKPTGNLVLHCDTSANYHVRLILDSVFGPNQFINEIIWHYRSGGGSARKFGQKHDTLYWYAKTQDYVFNEATVRVPYVSGVSQARVHLFHPDGKILSDVWDISRASTSQPDQFQYPTQKVPALLERIVGALSPRSGTVLDPCCGSGTTLVVSEQSGRNWIGVDRSPKAIEITRKRILEALDAGIPSLSLEDMSSDS